MIFLRKDIEFQSALGRLVSNFISVLKVTICCYITNALRCERQNGTLIFDQYVIPHRQREQPLINYNEFSYKCST